MERLAPARSCGGAHEFIWPKLVKADLSHFKPNAQTQRNISLLIHDEDRVDIAITLVKGARSSFRRVALLVHFLGWTLQHSQRILDYVEEIQDTIEEIVFVGNSAVIPIHTDARISISLGYLHFPRTSAPRILVRAINIDLD